MRNGAGAGTQTAGLIAGGFTTSGNARYIYTMVVPGQLEIYQRQEKVLEDAEHGQQHLQ